MPQTRATDGFVEINELEFVPYDEDDATAWPNEGFWEAVWEAVGDTECIEVEE